MGVEPVVFVIDDHSEVRDALKWLVESVGIKAETFANALDFLRSYDPTQPGCLIVDVRMPGMSGLELQGVLRERGIALPIIIISGHADVPMAVRAMRAGALDFIEKPFNDQVLLDRINQAIEVDAQTRRNEGQRTEVIARLATLSKREHEVLRLLVSGKNNREMAEIMDVTSKTIEAHRAKIMEKMAADNVADLVRIVVSEKGLIAPVC